ncbi:hypothetical protein MP228_004784 [Amoeboaphelidium protococcarum]|nr:hypothetical protein MP228_004784 [Amoeboaphelidium protococcarum]
MQKSIRMMMLASVCAIVAAYPQHNNAPAYSLQNATAAPPAHNVPAKAVENQPTPAPPAQNTTAPAPAYVPEQNIPATASKQNTPAAQDTSAAPSAQNSTSAAPALNTPAYVPEQNATAPAPQQNNSGGNPWDEQQYRKCHDTVAQPCWDCVSMQPQQAKCQQIEDDCQKLGRGEISGMPDPFQCPPSAPAGDASGSSNSTLVNAPGYGGANSSAPHPSTSTPTGAPVAAPPAPQPGADNGASPAPAHAPVTDGAKPSPSPSPSPAPTPATGTPANSPAYGDGQLMKASFTHYSKTENRFEMTACAKPKGPLEGFPVAAINAAYFGAPNDGDMGYGANCGQCWQLNLEGYLTDAELPNGLKFAENPLPDQTLTIKVKVGDCCPRYENLKWCAQESKTDLNQAGKQIHFDFQDESMTSNPEVMEMIGRYGAMYGSATQVAC